MNLSSEVGQSFFNKNPSKIEVINDSNGELINFYKVIKTNGKKLEREIKSTLHSREYHQTAKVVLGYPKLFNEVKRAWAIWTLANQSYASKLDGNWGYNKKKIKQSSNYSQKRISFTKEYAERLENVQIDNSDALRVINIWDNKDTFFYLDPPYFNSNQGHYKGYTKEDFEKLLQLISELKGKFILSSYPSETLTKYSKQNKWTTKIVDTSLCLASNQITKSKRKVEVLTANFKI